MVEILEHEGLAVVHGVAHDWGCFLLGRLANYCPARLASVSFLVVAYRMPGEVVDLDGLNAVTKRAVGYEVCGYWRFFEREEAGDLVDKNVSVFISGLLFWLWRRQTKLVHGDFLHSLSVLEGHVNNIISSTPSTAFATVKIRISGKPIWHH